MTLSNDAVQSEASDQQIPKVRERRVSANGSEYCPANSDNMLSDVSDIM